MFIIFHVQVSIIAQKIDTILTVPQAHIYDRSIIRSILSILLNLILDNIYCLTFFK